MVLELLRGFDGFVRFIVTSLLLSCYKCRIFRHSIRETAVDKSGKTCCSSELSFKIANFSVLVWCYLLNTNENGGYRRDRENWQRTEPCITISL